MCELGQVTSPLWASSPNCKLGMTAGPALWNNCEGGSASKMISACDECVFVSLIIISGLRSQRFVWGLATIHREEGLGSHGKVGQTWSLQTLARAFLTELPASWVGLDCGGAGRRR